MIVLVDYGLGNIASVSRAIERTGYPCTVSVRNEDLERASWLVVPGVGAFADAMRRLREQGLIETLHRLVHTEKKNYLGICLGFQVLATTGFEDGVTPGLGWIPGEVQRISAPGMRVPHIGWNDIEVLDPASFQGVTDNNFYFMHSYHFRPRDRSCVTSVVNYGEPIVATIRHGNIVGAQFHPEKSQEAGIAFLRRTLAGGS